MVKESEKRAMRAFLESRLADSNLNIKPVRKEIVSGSGINSDYMLIGDDGIVLMVNQAYPNNLLARIHGGIVNNLEKPRKNFGFVFFKDGKTFFRSAAARDYAYKSKRNLSLKNYDAEEMRRIMLLRPEEIHVSEDRNGWVQYYQPQSARLPEALVTYKYGNVEFDYSHLAGTDDFRPADTESKRLYIWNRKVEASGRLRLIGGMLNSRDEE